MHELFINSLRNDDNGQPRIVVVSEGSEGGLELRNLDVAGVFESTVADAVTKHDHAVRQIVVYFSVLFQAFDEF